NRRDAARLYREALDHDGLEPAQKQRLVARLLALHPESVRPFREAGRMRGLPLHAFETGGPHGSEYILVEESSEARAGHSERVLQQDAEGQRSAERRVG